MQDPCRWQTYRSTQWTIDMLIHSVCSCIMYEYKYYTNRIFTITYTYCNALTHLNKYDLIIIIIIKDKKAGAQKLAHKWEKSNSRIDESTTFICYTQSNKPLSEELSHQMEECNWYGRWSRVAHYLCLNVMLRNLYHLSLHHFYLLFVGFICYVCMYVCVIKFRILKLVVSIEGC